MLELNLERFSFSRDVSVSNRILALVYVGGGRWGGIYYSYFRFLQFWLEKHLTQ